MICFGTHHEKCERFEIFTMYVPHDVATIIDEYLVSEDVTTTRHTFALKLWNGDVLVHGDAICGDITMVQNLLRNVKKIYSNSYAFTALKYDDTIVTWGKNVDYTFTLKNVDRIFSTDDAFACILKNDHIETWGNETSGGKGPFLQDVDTIFSTSRAFVAKLKNGRAVAWGNPHYGGNNEHLQRKLIDNMNNAIIGIYSTRWGFLLHMIDKSVMVWNGENWFGNIPHVEDVIRVIVNDTTFGLLTSSGRLFTWGTIIMRHDDVVDVHTSNNTFVITFLNGDVKDLEKRNIIWNVKSVKSLHINDDDMVMLTNDSCLFTRSRRVSLLGVAKVVKTKKMFMVLFCNNDMFAWGNGKNFIEHGVLDVYATDEMFLVHLINGKVIIFKNR